MNILSLRRISSGFITIATKANMVGTGLIFVLVAILNADVFARGVLNSPFKGVVELVVFSLVLIVFLQLPDVVRSNRLTRSDGFLLLLQSSNPGLSKALSKLIDLVAGIFMLLISWTIWPEFFESFESCHFITPPEFGPEPTGNLFTDLSAAFARCEYAGTPGVFTAPYWPVKLVIALSVSLCSIIFFIKVFVGDTTVDVSDTRENA